MAKSLLYTLVAMGVLTLLVVADNRANNAAVNLRYITRRQQWQDRHAADPVPPKSPQRPVAQCVRCGAAIRPRTTRQRFCSRHCRAAYWGHTHRRISVATEVHTNAEIREVAEPPVHDSHRRR